MHLPTARAAFVADSVVVNVVADVTVTVAGVVEPDAPDGPREGSATAILEPATDVTFPDTMSPKPRTVPGRKPPPGWAPDGRVVGNAVRLPGGRVPKPPPKPPRPHVPLTGAMTTTLVAVIAVGAVAGDAGAEVGADEDSAVATTHIPVFTADSEVAMVWVYCVAEVTMTAVCPALRSCTWTVDPLIAAITPDAAGALAPPNLAAPLPLPAPPPPAGLVEPPPEDDAADPLLQPASSRAAAPAVAQNASARRRVWVSGLVIEGSSVSGRWLGFIRCAARRSVPGERPGSRGRRRRSIRWRRPRRSPP